MKNAIKFLTIAILIGISILAVNAQESTIVSVNETPTTTKKVEKKETVKKQQSSDDDSWTGFYVGGFGGFTNGKSKAVTSTTVQNTAGLSNTEVPLFNQIGNMSLKSNSYNAGGTFGYNYQKKNFLVGVEADFGANKIKTNGSGTATFQADGSQNITMNQSMKTDWMATFRPRIGVATKKVIVYGTVGMAVTNITYTENYLRIEDGTRQAATQSASFKRNKLGWTVGAGAEFKVAKPLSVKGEYLYTQFGKTSITSNNHEYYGPGEVFPTPNFLFLHSADLKSHSLRFGVNYRF